MLSKAARSSFDMREKMEREAAPSPSCHMMASVRLRARPSCRK